MSNERPMPSTNLEVRGNVENSSSVSRYAIKFAMAPHKKDSGLVLTDPADYYMNMDLPAVRALALWLSEWGAYQAARFKPTGFALVNLVSGERRERPAGAAIVLVGDSFYIRDENGTDLTGALPLYEWEIQPMYAPPTT
jgi:hypothetical protein